MQAAAVEAVLPLFRAMADGAEAALLRMHGGGRAAWAAPEDAPGGVLRASPYMADTTALLAHCRCGRPAHPDRACTPGGSAKLEEQPKSAAALWGTPAMCPLCSRPLENLG